MSPDVEALLRRIAALGREAEALLSKREADAPAQVLDAGDFRAVAALADEAAVELTGTVEQVEAQRYGYSPEPGQNAGPAKIKYRFTLRGDFKDEGGKVGARSVGVPCRLAKGHPDPKGYEGLRVRVRGVWDGAALTEGVVLGVVG
jgi:hypothetical protein